MTDARVEAELVHDVVALLLRTRHPDDPMPLELRNLPHHGPHRAGRGRHHDLIAGLQLTDFEQAGISGHARHAQHSERGGDGRGGGVQGADAPAVRQAVLLPPGAAQHEVAFREPVVPRRHHLPHRSAGHDVAQLDRRGVRRPGVHAAPHVRIERQIEGADEQLARRRLRRRRFDHPEVGLGREPVGTGVQQNLTVERRRHGLHRSTNARPVANPAGPGRRPASARTRQPHSISCFAVPSAYR